ncbi:MAG: hypothetical protein J6Y53_04810 [Alphaproteobacteria bacterium]|nr:hypothetical protein [Alphaproteobacteria bacterium]
MDKINPTTDQLREYTELRTNGKFPLPLFWRDHLGECFFSNKWYENATVLGIALPDKIILRRTIEPAKWQKEQISTQDLVEHAKQIHPDALPLHFGGDSSDGIINMLLLHGPKYLETSILLEKHGIKMPSLFEPMAYVAGGDAILAQENFNIRVFQIGQREQKSVPIKLIDKMIVLIPVSGYNFKVVSQESQPEKHDLDVGTGINSCDFPPDRTTQEKFEFSLPLFLRDTNGKYFVSNKIVDGCTVEGIALRDTIILRQTIAPCKIDKDEPTQADLFELAKQVHPCAQPLYFAGFPFGGGIITLLLIDKKKYIQTSELLRRYDVTMPDINKELYFVGGNYHQGGYVNEIKVGCWSGGSRIKGIEEMLLAIPRNQVE